VIRVAFKTPLKTRSVILIYETSLLHIPVNCIGFPQSCTPHFLQQIAPMDTCSLWVTVSIINSQNHCKLHQKAV